MQKILRIGVIGCGMWAEKAHIPYLLSRAAVKIVALSGCLTSEELGRKARKYNIAERFDDYEMMIKEVPLDAVLVSTPHAMHYRQVKYSLEQDLHVLVDKPLACQTAHAKELVALAEKKQKILMVANQRRYENSYQYIQTAIKSGSLGDIKIIHCLLAQQQFPDFEGSWRSDPTLNCGGILIDSGHHLIDSLLWACNLAPRRVYALTNNDDLRAEKHCSILVEFHNKALATITILRGAPKDSEQEEMFIYGSRGTIIFRRHELGSDESYELIHIDRDGAMVRIDTSLKAPEKWEPTANFIDALLQGIPILSSGRSNLPTIELIGAIYKSTETGDVQVL